MSAEDAAKARMKESEARGTRLDLKTESQIAGAMMLARKRGWCSVRLKEFTVLVGKRVKQGEDGLFRIPRSPCPPTPATGKAPKDETDRIRRLTIALKKCAFANISPEELRQVARDALEGEDERRIPEHFKRRG